MFIVFGGWSKWLALVSFNLQLKGWSSHRKQELPPVKAPHVGRTKLEPELWLWRREFCVFAGHNKRSSAQGNCKCDVPGAFALVIWYIPLVLELQLDKEIQKLRNGIWLFRSFVSCCQGSWYGHSSEPAQEIALKYLSLIAKHKVSVFRRTWDMAICIWLPGSFLSGCLGNWHGYSSELALEIAFKYLPNKPNIKSLSWAEPEIWMFASGCQGVLHLVAWGVGMNILLNEHWKLFSNTFQISQTSSLCQVSIPFWKIKNVGQRPQSPLPWTPGQVCNSSSCRDRGVRWGDGVLQMVGHLAWEAKCMCFYISAPQTICPRPTPAAIWPNVVQGDRTENYRWDILPEMPIPYVRTYSLSTALSALWKGHRTKNPL